MKTNKGNNLSRLYPEVSPEWGRMAAESAKKPTRDVSWGDFLPRLPQLEAISSAPKKMLRDIGFIPYTLKDESERYKMPNDPHYFNILVGGANAGGHGLLDGVSVLPFGSLGKGDNHRLFRNGDIDNIVRCIEKYRKNGTPLRVWGHSWGAGDIARLAESYPDVQFYAMDPVSWTGRLKKTPRNLRIYRPYNDGKYNGKNDNFLSDLAPLLGGRWPRIGKGEGREFKYRGGHVGGVGRTVNYIIAKEWLDRIKRQGSYDPSAEGVPYDTFEKLVLKPNGLSMEDEHTSSRDAGEK